MAKQVVMWFSSKCSSGEAAASQHENPNRTSKLPSERVVLLVLGSLLAAALIIFYRLDKIRTNQTLQTLKEENEALRRNLSETNPGSKGSKPTCPPPQAVKDETCLKKRPDWERYGGRVYYFSNIKSSWNESRRSCRDQGGDLVKIDSREEQMFLETRLRDMMENKDDQFWIGLTNSEEEGRWLWVDGSPLNKSLSFWRPWEPDDWKGQHAAGEDCVRMGMIEGADDLKCWFDQFCDLPQKSI